MNSEMNEYYIKHNMNLLMIPMLITLDHVEIILNPIAPIVHAKRTQPVIQSRGLRINNLIRIILVHEIPEIIL